MVVGLESSKVYLKTHGFKTVSHLFQPTIISFEYHYMLKIKLEVK